MMNQCSCEGFWNLTNMALSLAEWLRGSYLTSRSLNFLIWKLGTIVITMALSLHEIRWNNAWQALLFLTAPGTSKSSDWCHCGWHPSPLRGQTQPLGGDGEGGRGMWPPAWQDKHKEVEVLLFLLLAPSRWPCGQITGRTLWTCSSMIIHTDLTGVS